MGPKRRPNASPTYSPASSTNPQMKFRPVETGRLAAKGTKPLPGPATLAETFITVIVYGCKKVVLLEPMYRIFGYGILLFFVSLVTENMPLPPSYFSNSGNFLNQYFVKWSWGWTICLLGIFVYLTSSVYCCGKGPQIGRHFARLIIATFIWFIWTNLFQVIEDTTGQCRYTANGQVPSAILYSKGRRHCFKNGGKWTSLDVSGHSFILVWCTLLITEECKAIQGWDTIANFIRNEDHRRETPRRNSEPNTLQELNSEDGTPISHLTPDEFETLKMLYAKFGTWAKIGLVALTLLSLLWDGMLIVTACYFHTMIEKVLAGLIAVFMWFCTYKGLYIWDIIVSPRLPGTGVFKYCTGSSSATWERKIGGKIGSNISPRQCPFAVTPEEIPTFMGMPLDPLRVKPKGKEIGGPSTTLGVEGSLVPK